MIKICKKSKTMRICTGAGCRAWGSEKILSVFKESLNQFSGLPKYRLQAEGCMSKCGGGASINMDGKIYKAKDTEVAINILFQEQLPSQTY
jgi:NADH:ubiquinone oxidoreductase subunit E